MAYQVAGPRAYVNVYPHEGGVYAIEGGQLLACVTSKFIKPPAGTFELDLAPGGPNGPDVGPSWLDVITPMSFVMIGMTRGNYSNIVMLGVVTKITESWSFPIDGAGLVQRVIKVVGQDIGYFFSHFSWYALTFIFSPAAAALGIQSGNETAGAALATAAAAGGSLTQGTPDQLGSAWYKGVMDGPKGILSRSWFQYGKDNSVLFSDAVTVKFELFVKALKVLWSFTFVGTEETWWQKFNKIFPYPWYEFFIMTAPVGFYDTALTSSWNDVSPGRSFTMPQLATGNSSQIYVIARNNPLPRLEATAENGKLTFGSMDMEAWNKLPTFTEDLALISTTEEFCEEEVRNFYLVNPIYMKSLLGQANGDVSPPILASVNGGAAVDPASVHRYGFRPVYMETEWLSDPTGQIAQSGQMDFPNVLANLIGRLAAQYEPVSMMMRATRTGALRPDVIPGCKFVYSPMKESSSGKSGSGNSGQWIFYIEGVTNSYRFGGPSVTTLSLSRGLPSDVYADAGLLEAMHKGVAQRLNGVYQTGLPSSSFESEVGLEAIPLLPEQLQKVLGDIAPIYNTANIK